MTWTARSVETRCERLKKGNERIKRINQKLGQDVGLYVVPTDRLPFYQFAQQRIAMHFETKYWDAARVLEEAN